MSRVWQVPALAPGRNQGLCIAYGGCWPATKNRFHGLNEGPGFPIMIGLVLVTHGRLAEELVLAMEHVVGPQRHVAAVCIGPEDDTEIRRAEVRARVAEVRQGDGVVVLTDMLGGTPSNLATSMLAEGDVEVVAGVNLPLLVKLAHLRGAEPIAEAVEHAVMAGRKYLGIAGTVRGGCETAVGEHRQASVQLPGDKE